MSKYTLVHLNIANLNQGTAWNLISTIKLPAGSTTTYTPPSPADADSMTLAELKAYALAEFEKANG